MSFRTLGLYVTDSICSVIAKTKMLKNVNTPKEKVINIYKPHIGYFAVKVYF